MCNQDYITGQINNNNFQKANCRYIMKNFEKINKMETILKIGLGPEISYVWVWGMY